jgi:sugar lactone lactonase YvrE
MKTARVVGFERNPLGMIERICLALLCLAIAKVLMGAAPASGASQSLWVANSDAPDEAVQEFTPAELLMTGSPSPTLFEITGDSVYGLAFDKTEDLWTELNGNQIAETSPTQLANLGINDTPTPVAFITSSSFVNLAGLTFDHKGNLWAADAKLGAVDEISKKQLAAGTASLTPAIIVTISDSNYINFITFDKSGNLWVSDEDGDRVYELKAKQLKKTRTVTPAVILSSATFDDPGQIAFDGGGNLWITNYYGETVQKFSKKSIKKSGSPSAAVTISATGDSLNGPWGLAFDASGNLWISNYNDGSVSEFSTSQIKSSGDPTPAVHLTNTGTDYFPYQITFGPSF